MINFCKKLLGYQTIRFIISGGTSTLLTFILLYFFTEILKIWYLFSSITAYVIMIFTNFLMQKFWAFRGEHSKRAHTQLFLFFSVHAFILSLNTVLMYLLVEKIHLWYMLAQFFTACILVICSFMFYKFIIFKKKDFLAEV